MDNILTRNVANSQLRFSAVAPKIDPDDLIDSAEVAAILNLENRNAVSVYRQRYNDFPAPAIEKGRCVLWARDAVVAWATDHPPRQRA